jgi:mono/diheme cytochrome c family protein
MRDQSARLKACLSGLITGATVLSVLGPLQPPSGADAVETGKAVFSAYCVSCHGAAGDASTPAARKLKAADLRSDEVQTKSNEELFNTIAHGFKHKQ